MSTAPTMSRPALYPVIALLLAVQATLTLGSFHTRDDIFNDQPVLNVDFCSQY